MHPMSDPDNDKLVECCSEVMQLGSYCKARGPKATRRAPQDTRMTVKRVRRSDCLQDLPRRSNVTVIVPFNIKLASVSLV